MKRKVNRVGRNTLTVSFPSKWAKNYHLKQGDEVEVIEEENKLSILVGTFIKKKKEISINLDELDYFALAKLLIICFEEGYDSMSLSFSKKDICDSVLKKDIDIFAAIDRLVGRLVTFEIVSQSNNKIVIGDISEKLVKFDVITSRIFFLIEDYMNLLIEDIKKENYDALNARESRHDTIAKYVALACRILTQDENKSKSEINNIYLILNYLDKATDFIRYAYKHTQESNKKISTLSLHLMGKTLEYLKLFRSLYHKFDYGSINKLDILRGEVKELYKEICSKNPKELIIVSNLKCLVEMMNGAIKSRIAINLSKH